VSAYPLAPLLLHIQQKRGSVYHAIRGLGSLTTEETMSELDTPDLSRSYCPLCEPDADPTKDILQVKGCVIHPVSLNGLDDLGTRFQGESIGGQGEAGGMDNMVMCRLVHHRGA
jgi:hypothetical protein